MKIRVAKSEDLDRVGCLAGRLVRQHHNYDAQRFFLAEPVEDGYARFFSQELNNEKAVILVAELPDATIAGYVYGSLEKRDWNNLLDACGHFHDLYVDEVYRGKGVARALTDVLFQWFRDRGAPRVVLMSAWQNEASQALFRSIGFRPTMVEMTKELLTSS